MKRGRIEALIAQGNKKPRLFHGTVSVLIRMNNGVSQITEYPNVENMLIHALKKITDDIRFYRNISVHPQRIAFICKGQYELDDTHVNSIIEFLSMHQYIDSVFFSNQSVAYKKLGNTCEIYDQELDDEYTAHVQNTSVGFVINQRSKMKLNQYFMDSEHIIYCMGDVFEEKTMQVVKARITKIPFKASISMIFGDTEKQSVRAHYRYEPNSFDKLCTHYTSLQNTPLASHTGLKIEINIHSGVCFELREDELSAIGAMLKHATQLRLFNFVCKCDKGMLYKYTVSCPDILNNAIIDHPSIIDAKYPLMSKKAFYRVRDRENKFLDQNDQAIYQ